MRKWLFIPALLLLAIGSIYWFIPSQLNVVQITAIHCPTAAAFRSLKQPTEWKKWWPSTDTSNNQFQYNGTAYRLTKTLANTFQIEISHGYLFVSTEMNLLPIRKDSLALRWKLPSIPTTYNPISRIQRYKQAIAIKENMAAVANAFRVFAEKTENLYHIHVTEPIKRDTLLIATKTVLTNLPDTKTIYTQINAITTYTAQQKAQVVGNPIMNVNQLDENRYQLTVAVPVNKRLPDKAPFINNTMPAAPFLFTAVQGGPYAIQHTAQQLQYYVDDYRRTTMAIPFQTLVTDRSKEADTSKWITHFYVPVFPL